MIKIIKKGHPKKPEEIIRKFECSKCGCIFEASQDSCVIYSQTTSLGDMFNETGYCNCPDCGARCIGYAIKED